MEIKELKPSEESVDPELVIRVRDELRRDQQMLLGCHGTLWCGDKKIANLSGGPTDADRRLNISKSRSSRQDRIELELYAPLSRRSLSYIEEVRDRHQDGDVGFEVKVVQRIARLKMTAGESIVIKNQEQQFGGVAVDPEYERKMKLISANTDGEVLEIRSRELTLTHTVSSSDWAQKFCPALGLGSFLSFDYRVPEDLHSSDVRDEDTRFEKQLADAVESLNEMQNYIQAGEWNQASQHIRKVAELVRDWEEEIAALLRHDEIEKEAASEITDGMRKLFSYASKFSHRKDRSGQELIERSKASKEDAYLAYSIGTAVVNLVSAKLERTSSLEEVTSTD